MRRQTSGERAAKLEVIHPPAPDPRRAQLIRDWHRDQASAKNQGVALLCLSITECGQVKTSGLAIEPEHAMIMLGELETVSFTLRSYIESRRADLPGDAEVVLFGRCA